MRVSALFILFLVSSLRLVAQVITLSDTIQKYTISYPSYLEDTDASFTLGQVEKVAFVKSKDKVPDFLGNFSEAIWYKFDVVNQSRTDDWYLEIKGGFMHHLTVYQQHKTGTFRALKLSGDDDFRSRPVFSNNLVFPISVASGEKLKIYVRATSKTLIRTSMSLNTMQKLYEDNIRISYGDGFFTAVAVALLLYNLFVYFSLREKVYLYYIGYISTAILHTNLVAGHVQLFLPWLDVLNTTTILPVISFFSILFTNSFLQTQTYAPVIHKIRWPLIVLCLLPLVFYAFEGYRLAILLAAIFIFILFIYWLIAGIWVYSKGFAPAIFYIIGFGALVLMSVVFELKMKGWLEESYWTDSALFIGAAIEAVILSFALADKFNFYKKEKERLQEEAYRQTTRFARELISMQEAERKRIASELHDGLGQKLILIKNKILRAAQPGAAASIHLSGEALSQNVAEAIQEVRDISYGLRPYQLDLLGLSSSIKSLVEETLDAAQIDYKIHLDNVDQLFDNNAQINIYRIIQECVNNIVKHAAAAQVYVHIKRESDQVKIIISDDGVGFNHQLNHAGFGLKGIKERLQILEGKMTVTTHQPKGTLFEFVIPLLTDTTYGQ